MYHVGFLGGWNWVGLYLCTVIVNVRTVYLRTRWGMSDLLHYQAYCNKARRERQTERERRDRGRGGWRSSIRRCLRTNLFRQGVCAWAGMGEGLFLVCTSLFAFWTDASVGFSHPRTLHARRVRVACLLFVHQTLPVFLCVCVCVYPCLADGRTVGITRYRAGSCLLSNCPFLSVVAVVVFEHKIDGPIDLELKRRWMNECRYASM